MKFVLYSFAVLFCGIGAGASMRLLENNIPAMLICLCGWILLVISIGMVYQGTNE